MVRQDRKEFVDSLKMRMLDYSVLVTKFVDGLPKDLSSTILARQLLRSATSIGANFIEAQGAASTKDFANFLSIALKSANETLSLLIFSDRLFLLFVKKFDFLYLKFEF